MKTPVHVVGGFLGTGKTTALTYELSRREGKERCAVLVNDFGEAQIDATLLGGQLRVTNIPGGCVCCTAPEGLVPALTAILDELKPDRIFVEPSGLGRPKDIVDMLGRSPALAHRIVLGPTIVLVDPSRTPPDASLFAEQLDAADVLVANRCDLADIDQMAAFDRLAASLWPAPIFVAKVSRGRMPEAVWSWPDGSGPRASGAAIDHDHDHGHDRGAERPASTEGFRARSWVFPPDAVFAWDALRELVSRTPGVERFKGVFRTELGWYRLDLAGGVVHPAATAFRRDSRADVIVTGDVDLDRFDAHLRAARLPDRDPDTLDATAVVLVDASGLEIPLSRGALMALPGQVADVGAVAPGKRGAGVSLAEVLLLAGEGARYVVSAGDGFTTPPAEVAGVGRAVLVHSLDNGALPEGQGGPFRVYQSEGSNCANVKAVARVRVLRD
ncbi:hypothetical protein LBMAG42_43420 [Deltaproteobacteria bacterium]|nr:hypothetical protein LBMAG42_43420 [Deltaproteobacteria bacterium]